MPDPQHVLFTNIGVAREAEAFLHTLYKTRESFEQVSEAFAHEHLRHHTGCGRF